MIELTSIHYLQGLFIAYDVIHTKAAMCHVQHIVIEETFAREDIVHAFYHMHLTKAAWLDMPHFPILLAYCWSRCGCFYLEIC